MNILVAILAIIAVYMLWYFRPRSAAGRAKRGVKRLSAQTSNLKRDATGFAAIKAIDDPMVAAATLMVSIQSEEFVLGEGDEEIIAILLARLVEGETAERALEYGRWAALQEPDTNLVIDTLGNFLKQQLTRPEKVEFLELLDEAEQKISGCHDYGSSRMRLASQMGLKVLH